MKIAEDLRPHREGLSRDRIELFDRDRHTGEWARMARLYRIGSG